MMEITARKIAGVMFALPWDGHVELPDFDIVWLSEQLERALTARNRSQCENCEQYAVIIVPTQLGGICEACIDNIGNMASDMRSSLEGDPRYERDLT